MNQRELAEIRRRIRPEHNSIQHIYGCYVNSNKEIIARLDESLGLISREEQEKYLALLKKALSGALGKNLLDISFATKQVMDSEEHRLFSALRKCALEDAVLRDAFYQSVIDNIDMGEENYLILLAHDRYDVPHYGRDGEADESGEVYQYILCAICPVKTGKTELGYEPEEKRFHSAFAGQVVAAPELGFLWPAFDDRTANIYNALFYSKNSVLIHQEFIGAVFRTPVPMSAGKQKESFDTLLTEALDRDCRFDVVQAMHEQLSERIALHKESRDPEPLTVSCEEMGEILENSGAAPEQAEAFCRSWKKELGEGAVLRPANVTSPRRMEIQTPEVRITVDPKYSYLVESRVIDGKKYLLISADGGVELNGVSVEIL
jgi:hypothetical protein